MASSFVLYQVRVINRHLWADISPCESQRSPYYTLLQSRKFVGAF